MQSIAEVVIVSDKRLCTSCKIVRGGVFLLNVLALLVPSSRPVKCVEILRRSIGRRLGPQKL